MKVEIKASQFEGDGIIAKKGDVVDIPDDADKQSASTRHALKTGNLVAIDLRPVTSEEVPEEESEEEGPAEDVAIEDLKYNELQKLAKTKGINSKGKKKVELIELLQD